MFFDRHIRVSEANLDDVSIGVLDVDSTLLPLSRSVERLVQRHLLALVDVTFLGEGGFHFGSSPVSPYLLKAS